MSNPWTDGSLINEKALDDPKVMEVVADLLKGTIYDVDAEDYENHNPDECDECEEEE